MGPLKMKIGVIELLAHSSEADRSRSRGLVGKLLRQTYSIMPQVVAVWCRQLGHDVVYSTHYGQSDPIRLLPDEPDVVFVSCTTHTSALAYALGKLYRRRRALTVIGGPHAKSFPHSCRSYFDITVQECDRTLIADILKRRFDSPAIVTSRRPVSLPTVEERMPEIRVAAFSRGRPGTTSVVPVLASMGCPYACDFCTDWNSSYALRPTEELAADLLYLSTSLPKALIAYHDPNFAVRFDETMAVIEAVPSTRRNRYAMESSLSVLKPSRLARLKSTNCLYVAPGVDSWTDYAGKNGTGNRLGHDKLEHVIEQFRIIRQFVPGLQANFLFGTDNDEGPAPAALTMEFIQRVPFVWPNINIPVPFGGTPLFDRYLADHRILPEMPLALYCSPYLATTLPRYSVTDYYDQLIAMYATLTAERMLVRRMMAKAPLLVLLSYLLRTLALRAELAEMRRIRRMLADDSHFLAFHEGRTTALPEFYHRRFEQRLGRYAELLPREERRPVLHAA
jgi:hypothetical protein